MNGDELVESECGRHGLDRHVCVHEAGHAVAAVDNGISFRAVVFNDDASAPKFASGLAQAAAAVDVGPDPTAWVQPDPLGSLRFVMGGVAAEHAVLGDSIGGGWEQDIKVWRRGSGKLDEQTLEELAAYIGQPMPDVWHETCAWAGANLHRITAVAEALSGHGPRWEFSQVEVFTILDAL